MPLAPIPAFVTYHRTHSVSHESSETRFTFLSLGMDTDTGLGEEPGGSLRPSSSNPAAIKR